MVALHAVIFGDAATCGRAIDRVRIRPEGCATHLVQVGNAPMLVSTDRARAVMVPLVGTSVDITVQDVAASMRGAG